jgi:hypothetical protein
MSIQELTAVPPWDMARSVPSTTAYLGEDKDDDQ